METEAPSKYITLVASDGFEFVVLREAAMVSPVIKAMLNPRSQFAEAKDARCVLHEISPLVLDKVVEYFHYSYQYKDSDNVKEEMVIPVELCLDLLTASYFLGLQ